MNPQRIQSLPPEEDSSNIEDEKLFDLEDDNDGSILLDFKNEEFHEFLNSSMQSEALEHPEFSQHEQHNFLNEGESFIGESSFIQDFTQTRNFSSQNPDELDQEQRRRINVDFTNLLNRFIPQLFQNNHNKTQELKYFLACLRSLKVNFEMLDAVLEGRAHHGKPGNQRRQQRNLGHEYKDHLRTGEKLAIVVHDSTINPFHMSHNPVNIFIEVAHSKYAPLVLDLLDDHLRDSREYYIKNLKTLSPRYELLTNTLEVQLQKGFIQFHVKAGLKYKNYDKLQLQIYQIYTELSQELKHLCAFVSYWASRRNLLDEQVLPEQAIYCMVTEFCILINLVPNIFKDDYLFWPPDKVAAMHQFRESNDFKLLHERFDPEDYIIYRKLPDKNASKKELKKEVHFLTFPKVVNKDLVKKKWADYQEKTKIHQQDNNLGVLVIKFFHSYLNDIKCRRAISLTTQDIPDENEKGYLVMDPILPERVLTPFLKKRRRPGQDRVPAISSNRYEEVRAEFLRAYELIIQGKFKELCEEKKTFS